MNSEQGEVRRRRVPRWLIGVAGGLALVVIGGAVTLKVLFPPERLRTLVIPQLEARVGRPVELEAIKLRVFPRIAVQLSGLAIASPPEFGDEPAVEVGTLQLQLRLWPLLRKRFELGQVRVIEPLIRYQVAEDGRSNFEGLGSPPVAGRGSAGRSGTTAMSRGNNVSAQEPAAAVGAPFVIEDLVIRDGTVRYSDRQAGRSAALAVNGRLAAVPAPRGSGALRSQGTFDLTDVRVLIPRFGADSLALPDLTVSYEALADLTGDSVAVRQLSVGLGGVPIEGSGAVRGVREARSIDFSFESGTIEIAELLASLPEAVRATKAEATGRMQLSLRAVGPLGDGRRPEVNGRLRLEGVGASYGEYGRLLDDGSGSVTFDASSLSVEGFVGQLMGRRMEMNLEVTDFEAPQVDGNITGGLDFERLAELKPGAPPAQGVASFDVKFSGPIKEPGLLKLDGPIRLSDVSYQSPSVAVPARIEAGTVQLTGSGVAAEGLPIQLGRSDLTVSFRSRSLLSAALSRATVKEPPLVEFSLASERLDWGEVSIDTTAIGYADLVTARLAGRRLEGRDPVEIARERYAALKIPPVNVTGTVRVGEFINPPTRARNVSFDVEARNGVLELRNLQGVMYGGQVNGGLSLDFSGGQPPYTLRYELKVVGAEAANFVARWTRLGQAITGRVDFNINGTSVIDDALLPKPVDLNASGATSFRDGRFQDFGITRALTDRFQLEADRLSSFRALGGAFEIKEGAFVLQDWEFSTADIKAGIGGSAGLGGALDLKLAIDLPPSVLQKAGLMKGSGPVGDLLGQLSGGDEAIPLSVGIGGTMTDPAIQLDTEALQAELAKRLEGSGRDLLKRLIKPPPN